MALASQLGVSAVQRFLMRAGFTTFDKTAAYYGLGITLGNAEVRLDELVAAYSAFARGGEWIAPTWRRDAAERERHALVSPRTAFWIGDILSDSEAREYIFGRGGSLEFPFPVAAKTGTSQAYHDNWTIGYTPRRDSRCLGRELRSERPLRDSSGVTGAGPIFHAVMLAAERRAGGGAGFGDDALAAPPEGLVEREICVLSGMAANRWCPSKRREYTPAGDEIVPCSWHHEDGAGVITIWPPEYQEWARKNGLLARPSHDAPAVLVSEVREARPGRAPIAISSPPAGATYLIDPTLRRQFQTAAPPGGRRTSRADRMGGRRAALRFRVVARCARVAARGRQPHHHRDRLARPDGRGQHCRAIATACVIRGAASAAARASW